MKFIHYLYNTLSLEAIISVPFMPLSTRGRRSIIDSQNTVFRDTTGTIEHRIQQAKDTALYWSVYLR